MQNVRQASYLRTLLKSLLLLAIVMITGILSLIVVPKVLTNNEWFYVLAILVLVIVQVFIYYKTYSVDNKLIVAFIFSIITGIILGSLTGLLEVVFPTSSILVVTITLFVLVVILLIFNLSILFNPNKKLRYYLIICLLVFILAIIALTFLMYAKLPYCHPFIIILEFVLIIFCIIEAVQTLSHVKKEIEYGSNQTNEWLYASNIVMMIMMTYVEIVRIVALLIGYKKKSK